MNVSNEYIKEDVKGYIHSFESFGAVDGPGIRFIVFMQGCAMRCIYCHNPDSWKLKSGRVMSSSELFSKIIEYRNFIRDGGVTFSGGEPLLQINFLYEILLKLKDENIHTAIDTAGSVAIEKSKKVIELADLILLDVKSSNREMHRKITGLGMDNTKNTLDFCEKIKKSVWIRHVLLEGYTLDENALINLADFLKNYSCIERVELLPFHKMGEYKWKELKKNYTLYDLKEPDKKSVMLAKKIFKDRGFNCP